MTNAYEHGLPLQILVGDALERLSELPDGIVQTVVTSPPYYGLRDYGTANFTGGDSECEHSISGGNDNLKPLVDRPERNGDKRQHCIKCGAVRIDRQIGLERIPDCLGWATGDPCGECYICNMVQVFREVRRVLRDDGTCWVNIGDSYATHANKRSGQFGGGIVTGRDDQFTGDAGKSGAKAIGLKEKDMMLIPHRLMLALQADGWYVRSDIIWHKSNGMPESVTDRPTKNHEHIILLSKKAQYFYDAEAVKQPLASSTLPRYLRGRGNNKYSEDYTTIGQSAHSISQPHQRGSIPDGVDVSGANLRDVWQLPTAQFNGAHFATFPDELPERCIKAGTSEYGCCSSCGAGFSRIVERVAGHSKATPKTIDAHQARGGEGIPVGTVGKSGGGRVNGYSVMVAWEQSCGCEQLNLLSPIVLDPFCGAGTTGLVARRLGRRFVGIELNAHYAQMALERIAADTGMSAEQAKNSGLDRVQLSML